MPQTITLSELVATRDGFTNLAYSERAVNNAGGAALGLLRSSDLTYGIYFAAPDQPLTPVAVAGDRTPDGKPFVELTTPSINKAGIIAFVLPSRRWRSFTS